MEKILKRNGFIYNNDERIWERYNWVIRFKNNQIEAYNEYPTVIESKYICLPNTVANLLDIIHDINE